ncbi:hypothetical protein JCM14036_10380 [Desulfotomaculum defluvii]
MPQFPIAAFYKNIIFTKSGRAFAMYRIPPRLWRFFSAERKTATVGFLSEILSGFTGRGQLLLLWQELAIDEGDLKGCLGQNPLDLKCRDEAIRHARSARAAQSRGARIRRRFILFELSLKQHISDLQDFLMVARDTALKTLLSIRPMQIPDSIKLVAENAEQERYLNIRQYGLSRATFNDLDFTIRKVADRIGVLPPPLPERDGGVLTPAMAAAFTDGAVLDEKLDHIVVSNGNVDRHLQSFVFFVDTPEQLPPIGRNIFDPGEISFPFDVSIHFEIIPAHTAESKVDSKKRMLKGQMVEALGADESPDSDEVDGIQDSNKLKKKLKTG